jgi:predicted Zn-dependent peptidase
MARVMRKDPAEVADALRQWALYGESSHYLRDYGSRGTKKLSPEDLLAAWAKAQTYELDLTYTGSQAPEVVAELLREHLALDAGPERLPAVEHVVYPRVLPERDTVYYLPKRSALQSQLSFLVQGEAVPEHQLAAAHGYAEYLGGNMSGLVFQEVREFRALAYAAWGGFRMDSVPTHDGYFIGAIGCQGDKTSEAIEVMMGLIHDMPRKPERIGALRSALARRQETVSPSFRQLPSLVRYWGWQGWDHDPRAELMPQYAALEFADIEAFYEAQVADRPVTLVVVGDPRRIDAKELRRWGEVVKVKQRQIFAR